MPWSPEPVVKSGAAYLAAIAMILLAFLFLGWLYGIYLLATSGVVWYAAKPKTG